MQANLPFLLADEVSVQNTIGDLPAYTVGLGSEAKANLEMRKQLKKEQGPPFGGMGFFDPKEIHTALAESCAKTKLPSHLTMDLVRSTKLNEFVKCAEGKPSMYFWALQPIFNTSGCIVAAEILIRARNGSDAAPFEDVFAIMEEKKIYTEWKAAEVVDWTLQALRDFPILQSLDYIVTNVRPLDLPPTGLFFQEVSKRINALCTEDRKLLLGKVVIEVTEDQLPTEDLEPALEAWKDLGFRLSYDDTIGEQACKVLVKSGTNFHTPAALEPILEHFSLVKVDIEWAGYGIFLSHPSYSSRSAMKTEVFRHARDEDFVYIPQGSNLKNTGIAHSVLLSEFANWATAMIAYGKPICIELSVKQEDENNAFALNKLKDLGLDIFGAHRNHFFFQGGATGAKAFQPNVFAIGAVSMDLGTPPAGT